MSRLSIVVKDLSLKLGLVVKLSAPNADKISISDVPVELSIAEIILEYIDDDYDDPDDDDPDEDEVDDVVESVPPAEVKSELRVKN